MTGPTGVTSRWVDTCGCGEPLHYNDPRNEALVRDVVERLGETIEVRVLGGDYYRVPRHYIALHGIHAEGIETLAARYGWEKVQD